MNGECEESPRVSYGDGAQFVRICPKCGRFVRPDPEIITKGEQVQEDMPNATCRKCGRVAMPFEGWFEVH